MQTFLNKLIEKSLVQDKAEQRNSKFRIGASWQPDIVISRDPGSGGRVIAQKIAKKLGWQLLDRQIMEELSRELGIPENEFAEIDEHGRSWIADTVHALFNTHFVSDITYINHLKRLLVHAAKKSDLVIVGRGANHIIPADKCLRVKITASWNTRVDNTFKYEKKSSRDEAEEWVKHVETKRNKFIEQYFGCDNYHPEHFDLVVNTDYLTLDTARDMVIDAFLAKFPDMRRKLKNKLS